MRNARAHVELFCRLMTAVAPKGMRDWSAAMIREIEEIDDPRAALRWASSCLLACVGRRLRGALRIGALMARLALAAYCLLLVWGMSRELGGLAAYVLGRTADAPALAGSSTVRIGSWVLVTLLFAAAAVLVTLRRSTAGWTVAAATVLTTMNFLSGVAGAGTGEAASAERAVAYQMIAALLSASIATFLLTRRREDDLVV